jgi:hypothetical protein
LRRSSSRHSTGRLRKSSKKKFSKKKSNGYSDNKKYNFTTGKTYLNFSDLKPGAKFDVILDPGLSTESKETIKVITNDSIVSSVKSEAFGGYTFDFYKSNDGLALVGFNGSKSLLQEKF